MVTYIKSVFFMVTIIKIEKLLWPFFFNKAQITSKKETTESNVNSI